MARGHVITHRGVTPQIAEGVFIAETAVVSGDVVIGSGSSVWFGVVIRGDSGPIRIGERVNIQDGTIVHVDEDAPVTIGDDVTVGHRAIVHGTTIGANTLIGMGAILLSRSKIGRDAVVGAGALVPEGATVESGTLVMGIPAKPRRELAAGDRAGIIEAARHYTALRLDYQAWQDRVQDKGGE